MKGLLQSWLAVIAVGAMVSPAVAQFNVNQGAELGSYESIVARAGIQSAETSYSAAGVMVEPLEQPIIAPRSAGRYNNAPPVYDNGLRPNGYRPSSNSNVSGQGVGYVQEKAIVTPTPPGSPTPPKPPAAPQAPEPMSGESMNGGCATGNCGSATGTLDSYFYSGNACDSSPVYRQRRSFGNRLGSRFGGQSCEVDDGGGRRRFLGRGLSGGQCGGDSSNTIIGVAGLFFVRDYESRRSYSEIGAGTRMYSTDADHDVLGGFEASVQKRTSCDRGWELRYWGLFEDNAVASLAGAPVYTTNNFLGMNQLNHVASGATVYDIYQQGNTQTLSRDTDINNLEFNLLNNGGCFTSRTGRRAMVEFLAGLRFFQFDESLSFSSDSTFGGYPPSLTYLTRVDNTLFGVQVGGRAEYNLSGNWKMSAGSKGGIYNNRVEAHQSITDDAGAYAQIGSGTFAGDDYDMHDGKDDVAFLGELDLGLIYQRSNRSRFKIGYRMVGVAGVALADSQIPYDYTDVYEIERTRSDDALLLHGGYAGIEFSR